MKKYNSKKQAVKHAVIRSLGEHGDFLNTRHIRVIGKKLAGTPIDTMDVNEALRELREDDVIEKAPSGKTRIKRC